MALLALLALAALASAMTFDEYVVQYNKQYEAKSAEWFAHEATFIARMAEIEAHNSNPTRTYNMAINQFTDMTVLERKAFLGHKRIPFAGLEEVAAPVFHTPVSDLPAAVDWRTKGAVTPIKNQGQCGSCWAFATTETLESHAALTTNPPTQIILSPQQLVNCVPNPKHCGGTGGCSGATPEVGYTYLASCGGQTTEKLYPYTARDGACKFDKTTTPPAVAISGYVKIDENNYTAVMNAIANIGPIAISVEADTWFSYSSGILPATGCNLQDTDIDHNVQLVGYGSEGGKDYWIVRNSWGATWGESGYIRLARSSDGKPCSPDKEPGDGSACEPYPKEVNVCGTCGILYDTCYPVGVKIL